MGREGEGEVLPDTVLFLIFLQKKPITKQDIKHIQGHPMDLFLKISFLQTNFLLAGRFGKNNMSLERKCCC